ncbi:hypothetical protein ACAW74_16875 [Fibrella sp. WM1]|uniref:hypothetical protein n=1 Tax=Fibrella musci TaxID=3242485 RepID=UPI003520872E
MLSVLEWFTQVVFYLIVIPIGVGLFCWQTLTKPLRIFWLSQVVGLLITVGQSVFFTNSGRSDNYPLFYANTATDAVLMTLFFTAYLRAPLNRWAQAGCLILLLFMGWGLWYWGSSIDTVLRFSSVECCFVIVMAVLVGQRQLARAVDTRLRQQPVVWITAGTLIMNLMSLIMNLFSSQLYAYSADLYNAFYNTFAPLSNLISYVFVSIGFWKSRSILGQSTLL